MTPWAFSTAGEIRFGAGVSREAVAAARAAGRRVLVVTGADPARAGWLTGALAAAGMEVATAATAGEPELAGIEAALAEARAFRPDVVIGIGGGSAIDAAKALAGLMREPGAVLDHLEVIGRGLPLTTDPPAMIAVPTTAGTGAEVTRNAVIGVKGEGRKVSLRDRRLLPRLALIDPELTLGLPRGVTAATGLDALTQVIEPWLSPFATPMTDALCRDAIPRGLAALPRVLEVPGDREARTEMAWVSLCGGLALANAKLGAVHGLAGVIGGRTGAAHGAICGRLLPRVLAANEAALAARSPSHPARARLAALRGMIAGAFGVAEGEALDALAGFVDGAGVPGTGELGIGPGDVTAIAEAATLSSSMKGNPVELTAAELAGVLSD
ncbi:iron-containing alcohol dehydrogenase [Limibaculum sp. FT325]|uniref:iron-containing alcohol dehydrogenase n=1 Tax=Thermohalobaculum sediminis TaxID=2939436 RepID=UPI0020BD72F2|nr:iron-containing alcohol dehydrogenase [Limibaculum sediminis]MCL5778927.1 iron-containing alcohol dehydrogenase [Limibaculum sediminis]